jgi:hypothetical protein
MQAGAHQGVATGLKDGREQQQQIGKEEIHDPL